MVMNDKLVQGSFGQESARRNPFGTPTREADRQSQAPGFVEFSLGFNQTPGKQGFAS